MTSTVALSLTKWALDVLSKLIKADVRLHNAEVVRENMSIIFAPNHFTRLETILLPYFLNKHTGRMIMGLAAAELFQGPVGDFLQAAGAVSTRDPDRDKIIVRSLLQGKDPWIIYPEGMMIKDKKVIGPQGELEIYSKDGRRAPHTGAALLALRAEFYRHMIECLHARPHQEGLDETLQRFGLQSVEEVLQRRTVIIPINITYFPIRAHENILLRLANRLSDDLSKRAVEELSVEGTVLSEETDIDITLGEPIDVRACLDAPQYASIMACGLDSLERLREDPAPLLRGAADGLMQRHMRASYELTTINHDHLFATLTRHQGARRWNERQYRYRLYLCAREIRMLKRYRMHSLLEQYYGDVLFDESSRRFSDFLELCVREELLKREAGREGPRYRWEPTPRIVEPDFHSIRSEEVTQVIANELEPLVEAARIVKHIAQMPGALVEKRVRKALEQEDIARFEEDYARYYDPELSKDPNAGRPYLLRPWRVRGGIVLAHGYMAGPLEVRAMANYFCRKGYIVYGVRMPGHGTSPANLATAHWEEWYTAFSRGYAIVRSLTPLVHLGGFSTGGTLALLAAARKGLQVQSVFAVCAPLKLQNYKAHFAASLGTINAFIRRLDAQWTKWDYVDNHPENPHINYTKNPVAGINQLMRVIEAMEGALPDVRIPALLVQSSKDPIVNPSSASMIFERLGSPAKELTFFERNRHGIINGPGAEEVFERIHHFLLRSASQARGPAQLAPSGGKALE